MVVAVVAAIKPSSNVFSVPLIIASASNPQSLAKSYVIETCNGVVVPFEEDTEEDKDVGETVEPLTIVGTVVPLLPPSGVSVVGGQVRLGVGYAVIVGPQVKPLCVGEYVGQTGMVETPAGLEVGETGIPTIVGLEVVPPMLEGLVVSPLVTGDKVPPTVGEREIVGELVSLLEAEGDNVPPVMGEEVGDNDVTPVMGEEVGNKVPPLVIGEEVGEAVPPDIGLEVPPPAGVGSCDIVGPTLPSLLGLGDNVGLNDDPPETLVGTVVPVGLLVDPSITGGSVTTPTGDKVGELVTPEMTGDEVVGLKLVGTLTGDNVGELVSTTAGRDGDMVGEPVVTGIEIGDVVG